MCARSVISVQVSDDSGVWHDGDSFVCPDCTTGYPSVTAAASCDCNED